MKKRHQQKLVVLSLLLLLLLNLPILLLFDSADDNILGMPVIYIYIFSVWLFSVLMSWIVVRRYYE